MKKNVPIKRSLNNIIAGLNKPAFLFLIFAYVAFLALIIFVATPKRDYLIVPDYEHILYPEEVKAQITFVGLRTFDDSNNMTLRYSVAAKLSGKLNDNNVDPAYGIERFQMSAYLTTNRMHYFTEQGANKTPVSHTYTLDNATVTRIPEKFFISAAYKDSDNQMQAINFSEVVMLELTNKELYTGKKTITRIVTEGETQTTVTDLRLSFIATNNDTGFSTSVRISPTTMRQNYHVDMQSWIVTEDGEALPFIGVYGYSDERSTFNQSNRMVNHLLNPVEIYAKLIYYVEEQAPRTIYYKEAFASLPTSHTAQPADPQDEEPPVDDTDQPNRILQNAIYIGGAMFLGVGVASGVYFINSKKKKKG